MSTEFEATLDQEQCVVNVTVESVVTLCKLYGPLIFCDIRVRLNYDTCQWIIEKNVSITGSDGEYIDEYWQEVTKIDGQ